MRSQRRRRDSRRAAHRRAGARARAARRGRHRHRPVGGLPALRTRRLRALVRRAAHRRTDCSSRRSTVCRSSTAAGLPGARLVACPGCYPTATILAAFPALEVGSRDRLSRVVVDAKSGVSGAGRSVVARDPLRRRERGARPLQGGRSPSHARDGAGALERGRSRRSAWSSRRTSCRCRAGCCRPSTSTSSRRLHDRRRLSSCTAGATTTSRSCTCTTRARCRRPPRSEAPTVPASGCTSMRRTHARRRLRDRQPRQGLRPARRSSASTRSSAFPRPRVSTGPSRWCERGGSSATPTAFSPAPKAAWSPPLGFTAAGVRCGLKPEGRRDLALV